MRISNLSWLCEAPKLFEKSLCSSFNGYDIRYVTLTPEATNLPVDILQTMLYQGIQNRDILYLPLPRIQGNLNYW